MLKNIDKKGIIHECRLLNLKPWQCPVFLFAINAVVILALVFFISSKIILDPVSSLLIIFFTLSMLLIFGYINVASFKKILEVNRMEAELRYIASHQLKTPLTELKWALELIEGKREKGENIEKIAKYTKMVNGAVNKMQEVINLFLEISRLETGLISIDKKVFLVSALTKKEIESFKTEADMKGQSIIFNSEVESLSIETDKRHLAIVIGNLISNAIHYSGKGKKIYIDIVKKNNDFIKWSIKDKGIGIPKEQQKNIFSKYFRADNSKDFSDSGSGIGLYVAKMIIKFLGGEIGFSSKEGSGSIFWFTIPIKNKIKKNEKSIR